MQFHSVPLPYQSSFLTNVHYLHRFDTMPSIEQLWNCLLQGQLLKKDILKFEQTLQIQLLKSSVR